MPSGVFPAPKLHASHRGGRASLALHLPSRRRRLRLDGELAQGADPATSAELTLRAAELSSEAGRRRLANALVETLGDARGPNLGAFRMKRRGQHAAVRESADDLLALVRRLRDDRPVDARGAAMTALIASDGASPLQRDSARELQHALRAARVALEPSDPAAEGVPRAA